MIARIRIEINLREHEVIPFLQKNVVKLRHKIPFGVIENTAIWKNLENPKDFKFKLNSFGPIDPWLGKCSIKEVGNKTILSVLILPPSVFLILAGIVLLACFYAIVQFGIHNYGTIAFLPSILFPTFAIGLVVLIWHLIARFNANKIKKDIVSSFEAQMKTMDF